MNRDTGHDARIRLELDRLDVSGLSLRTGKLDVDLEEAIFTDVCLQGTPSDRGLDLVALTAAQARLRGTIAFPLQLLVDMVASAASWRLDPVRKLDGLVNAAITDAAWILDADISAPIRSGELDFNQVKVEHIGPDSSMGASHMGVYVDTPTGRTYLFVFNAARVPGVRFERRGTLFGTVSERGAVDLHAFLKAALSAARPTPIARLAHHVKTKLDRTRVSGEFALGDGELGNGRLYVVLQESAKGSNKVSLSGAMLGHAIAARLNDFNASGAAFEVDGATARLGPTHGAVSARVNGLGRQGALVTLAAASLEVRDLHLVAPGEPPDAG